MVLLFCKGPGGIRGLLITLTQDASGGHGARGEVTAWHLLVFIGNEAIL